MFFGLFTILPFTGCLFWMAVLLLDWRRDNGAQHVLAAFMGASATLYLCHAAFFNHVTNLNVLTESLYAFCNIGVFPLYYLYIYRLTDSRGISAWRLTVLLPAVAIGLWTAIIYILCPADTMAENIRVTVMRIVFMAQLVPICWICYHRLRIFDKEIANYYADTETRSVRPTTRMMTILVGAAIISGTANLLGREYFDTPQLLIGVPSVLFTALIFGVGYVGKRQDFCKDDLIRDETQDSTPVTITEEPSQIITQLDKMMAESSLYLRSDLRLSEVATMLGVGRTTLSQRINQELQISFSEYINNLRVDHACRLLSDPSNAKITLTGVAELSGFSSDSSFYRAFRRRAGMTPKQYMESL